MLKKLKKIILCIFVFLAYRICLFGTEFEIAGETKTQPCWILTNNTEQQRARSICRLHVHRFCRARIN